MNPTQPEGASPEQNLLRKLQAGDPGAATGLYLLFADRLRRLAGAYRATDLAARFDPEDIVQSVFRVVLSESKRKLYDVPDAEHFWRLLVAIALNKLRSRVAYHHAERRDTRHTQGGDALQTVADPRPEAGDDRAFLDLVVRELLERLPAAQRRVAELRMEGHDVAGIAKIMGISKRTAERLLQECRGRLRELLTVA